MKTFREFINESEADLKLTKYDCQLKKDFENGSTCKIDTFGKSSKNRIFCLFITGYTDYATVKDFVSNYKNERYTITFNKQTKRVSIRINKGFY